MSAPRVTDEQLQRVIGGAWCFVEPSSAAAHYRDACLDLVDARRTIAEQAEEIEIARRWLTGIRDDDRNGRGEICYDEFSYKRREQELKAAAVSALAAMARTAGGSDV